MRYLASPAQLRASSLRWSLFTVPLVLASGFLSGRSAGSGPDNPWFAASTKPGLYPPPATFGIVWTVLYVSMGVASAMVLSSRGARGRGSAVAAFVVQLALNSAWSPVFFGSHRIALASGIIRASASASAFTIASFWRVRPSAAGSSLPYLAWVCFASSLNWQSSTLNPHADGAAPAGATVRVQLGH
ncbi:hypothetical protein OY671_007721 [Metschnikowia pulcherrima]|nr:hypothetical protein OY671_007721 [Metschnikowia pulcherrima]